MQLQNVQNMVDYPIIEPLFLDSETTGLEAATDELLSLAIIDAAGTVLLDTLVRPKRHTEWPEAQQIHGISPARVLRDEVPTLGQLTPVIADLTRDRALLIYNANFDCDFLREPLTLGKPASIGCLMEEFAEYYGDWHDYHQSYTWQPLERAARHVCHRWQHRAHSALGDCHAARSVWRWLREPDYRPEAAAAYEHWQEQAAERAEVRKFLAAQQQLIDQATMAVNDEWTRRYETRAGLAPVGKSAQESADVFCRHLLGFPLKQWLTYGKLLKLPRYGLGHPRKQPAHFIAAGNATYRFLKSTWFTGVQGPQPGELLPVAMRVTHENGEALHLQPLFSLRKLTLGVDYVPIAYRWPEGHCSATTLRKVHRLKPKQVAGLLPTHYCPSEYIGGYLLYAIPEPAAVVSVG